MTGTYPHPGLPDATFTAGRKHAADWLNRHLTRPRDLVVDIETYGVEEDAGLGKIKCVTLGLAATALVLDPRDPYQHQLAGAAMAGARSLVMHKANFDAPSLAINGMYDPRTMLHKTVCTLVMARMADPGDSVPKDLDSCVQRHLKLKAGGKITAMFKALGYTKKEGFARLDIDSPAYLMGAAADGIATARLLPVIWSACVDMMVTGHPFPGGLSRDEAAWEGEKQQIVNRWGIARTIAGLRTDDEFLSRYDARVGRELAEQETALQAVGVDPGNGNHLAVYLGKVGALPPDHPMTKGGKNSAPKPSTAAKHLEELNHPLAKIFVQQKKTAKIRGYLDKCKIQALDTGRIHPTTEVLSAAHGRSSMRGIEIHQFPAGARGIVLPDEGDTFTSTDWTAQEPLLGMLRAHDAMPLASYDRGERIYTFISQFANILDKQAKVVLLGGMYGEGLRKLSADLKLPPDPWVPARDGGGRWGYAAGRALQDAVWSALPRTKAMLDEFRTIGARYRVINTVAGRILPIPSGIQPWDGQWSVQVHKVGNYAICGSGADMYTDVIVAAMQQGIGHLIYFGMHDEFIHSTLISHWIQQQMRTPSERLIRMAGRIPVIRTDQNFQGERWTVS